MTRNLLALAALVLLTGCKKSEAATLETRQLFASTCARCHGPEGAGGLPVFDGGPSPQNFHDHAFQMGRTDEQLKQTIKSGKGTSMPAFGVLLNDDQIAGLVLQIRSFDSLDGEKKP